MPVVTLTNRDYPWVAVTLKWGGTTKNITMQANAAAETVDSGGFTIGYAWKGKNEQVTTAEFDAYHVDLDADADIVYGTPPEGKVPDGGP